MFSSTCPHCGEYLEHICAACTGRLSCGMQKTEQAKMEVCKVSAIICPNKHCRRVLSKQRGVEMKKFFIQIEAHPDGSETWRCCDAKTGARIPGTKKYFITEQEAIQTAKALGYNYEVKGEEYTEMVNKFFEDGTWNE